MNQEMLILTAELIILFFAYSVAGWCMEVILKYRQFHRFINRGFLIGPYCPIYGSGAVMITVVIGGTVGADGGYLETFLTAFVVCGALEYAVSWYMEKMFHARWWDYTGKPLNIRGRIWIGNLILFGLGGVLIVKWMDPVLFGILGRWPLRVLYTAAVLIIVLMVLDYVASHVLFHMVRQEIDGVDADNSEEVSLRVRALLRSKSTLLRRIGDSYPNLKVSPEVVLANLKKRQEKLRLAAQEHERKIVEAVQQGQEQLAETMRNAQEQLAESVKNGKEQLVESVKNSKEQLAESVKNSKEQLAESVKNVKEQMQVSGEEKKEKSDDVRNDRLK